MASPGRFRQAEQPVSDAAKGRHDDHGGAAAFLFLADDRRDPLDRGCVDHGRAAELHHYRTHSASKTAPDHGSTRINTVSEQKKDRRPLLAGGPEGSFLVELRTLSDHARLHTTGLPGRLARFRAEVWRR